MGYCFARSTQFFAHHQFLLRRISHKANDFTLVSDCLHSKRIAYTIHVDGGAPGMEGFLRVCDPQPVLAASRPGSQVEFGV